jgi:hypothetical protein
MRVPTFKYGIGRVNGFKRQILKGLKNESLHWLMLALARS